MDRKWEWQFFFVIVSPYTCSPSESTQNDGEHNHNYTQSAFPYLPVLTEAVSKNFVLEATLQKQWAPSMTRVHQNTKRPDNFPPVSLGQQVYVGGLYAIYLQASPTF